MDNLLFVYFGTRDYHFLIRKNIELLRRLYPNADVLVYDWGDENGRPSHSTFQSGVEVVSWSERVADTMELLDPLGADGLNELAKAFNSRERASLKRRFNKFFLKRYPNPSEQEIREGLIGNLCRCTGYVHIINAVRKVVQENQLRKT